MQLRIPNNNKLLKNRTRQSLNNHQLHPTQFTIERRSHNRHTNHFDLLYNEPEFYICHNYGHKELKCHLKNYRLDSRMNYLAAIVKFWKKNASNKCGLVCLAQMKKDPWYIDTGCSKHMTSDKSKFLFLSESKLGNVTFGNSPL